MNELKKEELLKHLAHMFKCYEYNFINVEIKPPDEGVQTYEQIKALIQKPGVTEEWIEEKAKKMKKMVTILFRKTGTMNYPLGRCKDFIRSLVKEMGTKVEEKVDEDWIQGEPYE